MKIELTKFAERQWNTKFAGTKMQDVNQIKFLEYVNQHYDFISHSDLKETKFMNTHTDFCKYFYLKNESNMFPQIKRSIIPITYSIYPYIQSDYSSRTPDELPVLSRFVQFPNNTYQLPIAHYIGLVLYTKEQLLLEHQAMFPSEDYTSNSPWSDTVILQQPKFELSDDCEYGIVSIMGLSNSEMDPMPPMTHLRNALGIHEGGNGVPINRTEYNKSVKFWSEYILVK